MNLLKIPTWADDENVHAIVETPRLQTGLRSEAARVHACQADLKDIRHLPSRAHAVLERFFRATNALEDKELEFLGWRGPKQAAKTVKRLSA
jgi:hypothetical protein